MNAPSEKDAAPSVAKHIKRWRELRADYTPASCASHEMTKLRKYLLKKGYWKIIYS